MIRIRESSPADNDALLELTRAAPMDGIISLRIDRDPDFEALNALRGRTKSFVAVESDKIIGCISASTTTAYVLGRPELVGYLADLKVHPAVRGGIAAFLLMRAAYRHSVESGAQICYGVVADGNQSAVRLLSGRASFPPSLPLGRFFVYSLLPSPFKRRNREYEIGNPSESEASQLVDFVNRTNAGFLFSPVAETSDFHRQDVPFGGKPDTLVARFQGDIVATASTLDTSFCKSNVVLGMPAYLQVLVSILRAVEKILPVIHAPAIGESLRILYVRRFAVAPGHEPALRLLIAAIRNRAFAGRYSFVTIGLHERDTRWRLIRRIPRFVFFSHLFTVSEDRSESRLSALSESIPVEDYALV